MGMGIQRKMTLWVAMTHIALKKVAQSFLTSSYRNSFFNVRDYKITHNTLLASCRAGNVIGGGDWAKDRLMTDIMMSVSQNKKVNDQKPQSHKTLAACS